MSQKLRDIKIIIFDGSEEFTGKIADELPKLDEGISVYHIEKRVKQKQEI